MDDMRAPAAERSSFLKLQWAMKTAVFWIVAPRSVVEMYSGDRHVIGRNVGKRLADYVVQELRRQPTSYSPRWELQISLVMKHPVKEPTCNYLTFVN